MDEVVGTLNKRCSKFLMYLCIFWQRLAIPALWYAKIVKKILENISKLTKQLQNLRSQVLQNLQALNHRNEQARMARKRPISCSNIDNHTRNNPTVAHGVTEASTIIYRPPSNLSSNNSLVSDNMSGSEEQMTADAILSTAMVSPPLTVSVLMWSYTTVNVWYAIKSYF